jgi:hypothetical protein
MLIAAAVGLSAACSAAIVLGMLLAGAMADFGGETEDLSRAQIEAIARIRIPPGAMNIHARAGGFQDRYIHVRFDIVPAELDGFLRSSLLPTPPAAQEWPFQSHMEPDRPWWRPANAEEFVAGSTFVNGISQAILIDTTDPARLIIYVATFET